MPYKIETKLLIQQLFKAKEFRIVPFKNNLLSKVENTEAWKVFLEENAELITSAFNIILAAQNETAEDIIAAIGKDIINFQGELQVENQAADFSAQDVKIFSQIEEALIKSGIDINTLSA